MKSFPNTLNRGGKTIQNGVVNSQRMEAYTNALNFGNSGNRSQDSTIKYSIDRDKTAQTVSNISSSAVLNNRSQSSINVPVKEFFKFRSDANETVNEQVVEDAFKMGVGIIGQANTYQNPFTKALRIDAGMVVEAEDGKTKRAGKAHAHVPVVQSLFNKYHFVQVVGMGDNVPLLNNSEKYFNDNHLKKVESIESQSLETTDDNWVKSEGGKNFTQVIPTIKKRINNDTSDCSIKKLVELSKDTFNRENPESLGRCTYSYADFMYCYDLGTCTNNHLITLRKFDHPVGDDIFGTSIYKGFNGENGSKESWVENNIGEDTARLVTWFGTDDNKLENILKYSYSASWKQLKSKIEQNPSEAENDNGFLTSLANTTPAYLNMQANGKTRQANMLGWLGNKFNVDFLKAEGQYSNKLEFQGKMYDSNKVYEPQNTIRDTHIYEGELKFNQSITLVFRYKLRAYRDINPKAAFLDLLGNILEMTYRHGTFWGGTRQIIGPIQDQTTWNMSNAIIDGGASTISNMFSSLVQGIGGGEYQSAFGTMMSQFMDGVQDFVKNGKDFVQHKVNALAGTKENASTGEKVTALFKNFSTALGGQFKNYMGRPAMYAWQSLLSGNDVGLWHLTIGNPRNPIATIGNLLMDSAEIEHSGILGVDDFPTELKVTIRLKPGRSRDIGDIERMYTKGQSSIWMDLSSQIDVADFLSSINNDTQIGDYNVLYSSSNQNTETNAKEQIMQQQNGAQKITQQAISDLYPNIKLLQGKRKKHTPQSGQLYS